MGTDGRAYATLEEMEDQHLRINDMRLHMMLHMAGVSIKMGNEAKVHKDNEERTSQSVFKTEKVSTTKNLLRKVGHHVHDSKKWIPADIGYQIIISGPDL